MELRSLCCIPERDITRSQNQVHEANRSSGNNRSHRIRAQHGGSLNSARFVIRSIIAQSSFIVVDIPHAAQKRSQSWPGVSAGPQFSAVKIACHDLLTHGRGV